MIFREGDLVRLTADRILSRVGWSPFLGQNIVPKPEMVYVGGKLVARSGTIVDDTVRGTLVSPTRAS